MELPPNTYDVRNKEDLLELFDFLSDTEPEAWLIFYKKGAKTKGLTRPEFVETAIRAGWIDGKILGIDKEKYRVRFTPRKPNSKWSLINKKIAQRLIKAGEMTARGLAAVEAGKASGEWDKAYTTRGEPQPPPDLVAALVSSKVAQQNFSSFTSAQQNSFILWIEDAKRSETRERRIAETVERARANRKLWD